MKKAIKLIICLTLVFSLTACAGNTAAPDAPAPAPAPAQTQLPSPTACAGNTAAPDAPSQTQTQLPNPTASQPAANDGYLTFDENSALNIDLDGNGEKETITVELTKGQEYELDKHTLTVTSQSGKAVSAVINIADFFTGYACDVDGDGNVELIACGNEETYYSMTWVLRYTDGELIFAAPCFECQDEYIAASASGRVIDIKNGVLIIEDIVDVLGTWGGTTQFELSDDPFALTRIPGSVWTRNSAELDDEFWNSCTMETIRELPVTFDGESSPATLEAGVKIAITESDYETYIAFITEDGRTGRILVSRDVENWGWLIDGIHESEYFESIPYAG